MRNCQEDPGRVYATIMTIAIKLILKKQNWSAPGPDRVVNSKGEQRQDAVERPTTF